MAEVVHKDEFEDDDDNFHIKTRYKMERLKCLQCLKPFYVKEFGSSMSYCVDKLG